MKKFLLFLLLFPSIVWGQAATPCSKYTFGALADSVQTVKASTAILCGYQILNTSGGVCYLQMFDTTGAVTLGTTTPSQSLGWPAGSAANIPATQPGISFTSGLKIAATTTRSGSTPCNIDVNIWYK